MALGRLIAAEAIYAAALVVLYFGGYWACSRLTTWQGNEWFYRLMHIISPMAVLLVIWITGAVLIVFLHLYRMARYFQDMTSALGTLVTEDDTPITLPTPLKQAEIQMNRLKNESIRNARAAKEAEQRKNDLVVYLAHDLKTPLTSVIGYLTLLCDEKDISTELQAKYMGIALDKAQRLEELINEFFDITRFSLTNLTLETEKVNLTRMLEQITFEFNPMMAQKELEWHLNLPPNMEIVCDPNKLERVFDNLIRNAVNYSYPRGTISVDAKCVNDAVVLRFENKGRTIPEEKLGRLFEQFYRLDFSRSSSTGGAGLGLAIAKEIVSLHGGTIKAESYDEKVIFTVFLPKDCKKIV
ncbi:MAG: HAMP domain-containing histidine kinase [Clostridiales bacterium]|nr:HAMP domain-containing histidine kinase [Clostridiales bacterium]